MNLIEDWIKAQAFDVDSGEYKKYSWAVDQLIDAAIKDPEFLWNSILLILRKNTTEAILKSVGAGPIEDLMVYHGNSFIEKIESEARTNQELKRAMKYTWIDNSNKYSDRFIQAYKS